MSYCPEKLLEAARGRHEWRVKRALRSSGGRDARPTGFFLSYGWAAGPWEAVREPLRGGLNLELFHAPK
jgi:hypothetical protein